MDERFPLSVDTTADAHLGDEIYYRVDIPESIDRTDCSSPSSTPDLKDSKPLGKSTNMLEPLAEEYGRV
jgi:hypothetical protein